MPRCFFPPAEVVPLALVEVGVSVFVVDDAMLSVIGSRVSVEYVVEVTGCIGPSETPAAALLVDADDDEPGRRNLDTNVEPVPLFELEFEATLEVLTARTPLCVADDATRWSCDAASAVCVDNNVVLDDLSLLSDNKVNNLARSVLSTLECALEVPGGTLLPAEATSFFFLSCCLGNAPPPKIPARYCASTSRLPVVRSRSEIVSRPNPLVRVPLRRE